MSNLSVFNFQSNKPVRVELKNNEPYFCLPDVAEILEIKNSRAILSQQLKASGVAKIYISSGGQKRLVTFVDEPNLYRVIFRSNKPEAEQFQDWIFEEVLPSIRKTGSYIAKDNDTTVVYLPKIDMPKLAVNVDPNKSAMDLECFHYMLDNGRAPILMLFRILGEQGYDTKGVYTEYRALRHLVEMYAYKADEIQRITNSKPIYTYHVGGSV